MNKTPLAGESNFARWTAVLALLPALVAVAAPLQWAAVSPDGQARLVVQLARLSGVADYPKNKARLYYRVERHGATVIPDSPLGLKLDEADLLDGLRFERAEGPVRMDIHYTMPHGKRKECRNSAQALTLRFRGRENEPLELDLRAFNDGVAFRYHLPGAAGARRTLQSEATGFAPPPGARLWMHPNDKATVYSPAYETYYENGVGAGAVSPTGMGWAFPVLFCTADEKHWGLFTESGLGPNYFGGRFSDAATGGVFRIRFPEPSEGHGYGALTPSSALPWEMPWRVILLGGSPGDLVESTLVNDLAPPTALTNTAWIKPGRVAWSWWSDQPSPRDGGKQKRFVDFAAEMGWEYVLVDANWTIMDNGTIHDVLRHAKSKNVGLLLWYNTGGPNNIVTEKPRDSLFFPEVRRFELQMLKEWGVPGIKVDFFQSDKPAVIALYHDILKDAADCQIMVNFHGCTLPRGWSRTYPHLLTMEAIRGEECYIFAPEFPARAPTQNTISPFTRNVVGPMDYTPVALADNRYPHLTTSAHELALAVLFESGWVHFADDPDVYRAQPEAVRGLLKALPTAWDDTRFVEGYPGREVVLARKRGDDWWVAGVNGRNAPVEKNLALAKILGTGSWRMTLAADGEQPRRFSVQTNAVSGTQPLKVRLLPHGGFLARLAPQP